MGGLLSLELPIGKNFLSYQNWKLSDLKEAVKKFEKIQTSFGWGVKEDIFKTLFDLDDATAKEKFDIWDTDKNGKTDILEVFTGIIICSTDTFSNKLIATFKLFDFDENNAITKDELNILLRTIYRGYSKMTLSECPETEEVLSSIDNLCRQIFLKADTSRDLEISVTEFKGWASHSPSAITIFGRNGTTDFEKYVSVISDQGSSAWKEEFRVARTSIVTSSDSKYSSSNSLSKRKTSIAKINAMSKPLSVKSSSLKSDVGSKASSQKGSGKIDPKKSGAPKFKLPTGRYSKVDVLKLKSIFDSMDTDGSGLISLKELTTSFGNIDASHIVSLFEAIDHDMSGSISFEEMLKGLYPDATPEEYTSMLLWANPKDISDKDLKIILKLFDNLDTKICGKVHFRDFLISIKNEYAKEVNLVPDKKFIYDAILESFSLPQEEIDSHYDFLYSINLLFGKTLDISRLKSIASRLPPMRPLTVDQQQALDVTFTKYLQMQYGRNYDATLDSLGKLDLSKDGFRNAVQEIGELEEDDLAVIFGMMDQDGSNEISKLEFKRAFRNAWSKKIRFT